MICFGSNRVPARCQADLSRTPKGERINIIAVCVLAFSFTLTAITSSYAAGPDVIVGELPDVTHWTPGGAINGIRAYSVATTSCNIGDQELEWQGSTNLHPAIAQNMYRLANGRMEQIGLSWIKHGFCALQQSVCTTCTPAGGGCFSRLGVGCSDPYSSTLNGDQAGNTANGTGGLGPRFEVNPHTGAFPFPYSFQGQSGNDLFKRIQVQESDLTIPGALYFVEGQYVHPDDAASGNGNNNASYRRIVVNPDFSISTVDTTQRQQAAIRAWQDNDPTVTETDVQVPSDGLFIVSAKATDQGGGAWHYEYAVQNINSDRSGLSFSVPFTSGATVFNAGFHDVNYHSGEPFDGTDWNTTFGGSAITWSTDDFSVNSNANALRWGTLYNFWFDSNATPSTSNVTLALFKPGTPATVTAASPTPTGALNLIDCNGNGIDDATDIANGTSADCNGNGQPDECEPTCPLATVEVASGLIQPLYATAPPGDLNRLFIVEQGGTIQILTGGAILPAPFLDISSIVGSVGNEQGLLSVAFHPNYAVNGLFYVDYTNLAGDTIIAQYSVSADPDIADAASAVILMTISQPETNHNGGQLQFGPDGMLYVAMGDGGGGNDQHGLNGNGQNINTLLGKILRLDVDAASPFIPIDNPFVGVAGLDQIWAIGVRNPWRFSFDRLTGDLYIADVGQSAREEIDFQPAASTGGENYGWRCMEGFLCTNMSGCTCNDPSLTLPILDIAHTDAGTCSITGGYVYRGCSIPWLSGTYFYADFCGDYIRTLRFDGNAISNQQDRTVELQPNTGILSSITSFGEDGAGELYIITRGGSVFQIVCAAPPSNCGNGVLDPGEQCDPPNGIDCNDSCQSICSVVLLQDDFETDLGWTVENLNAGSGDWQRGIPVDDPNWAFDPMADSDGSGQAYLTQNITGNTDVDAATGFTNGLVRLISPTIDMSAADITIRYDYYLNLTDTDGTDRLLVEINNNDGAGAWTEIARHDTNGGLTWRNNVITQADLDASGVTLTSTMKLRFTANDGDVQSIVEAGLDAVLITTPCPAPCPGADGDMNASGGADGNDIQLFTDAMINGPTSDELCHGDFDSSNTLNPADISGMVNALLTP